MIEGTITYKGEPVSGAIVSFQPSTSEGESASGRTDVSGKFTLTSSHAADGGRGALPGDYVITVVRRETPPPDPDEEAYNKGEIDYSTLQARQNARPPAAPLKSLIPEKYAKGSSSGLKATVVKGKNPPLTFELVD